MIEPKTPSRQWLLLILVVFTLFPPCLRAQAAAGRLDGRALDESEAALPGVSVTAVNESTGFSRTVVTGSDGTYRIPTLPIGAYDVTAELDGFTTVIVQKVPINVALSRALNFVLEITDVEEVIIAVDESPLIRTSASLDTVVTTEELETLPYPRTAANSPLSAR